MSQASHDNQRALQPMYRDLAGALDQIDADALERTSDQFIRYRALTHRLVALAEAVDPAQALDEQFSAIDVVAPIAGRRTRWGDRTHAI